jgi:hypothetical protein
MNTYMAKRRIIPMSASVHILIGLIDQINSPY